MTGSCRNAGGVVGSGVSAAPTLNCRICPVVAGICHGEIHSRCTAAERFIGAEVAEHIIARWHVGEVNDQVGTFRQPHEQRVTQGGEVHRRGQEATFVANLPDFHARNVGQSSK